MLDTVKLQSPEIGERLAAAIESRLVTRWAVDRETGQLLWEFTSGSLEGSYDHRIAVAVKRERWESVQLPGGRVSTLLRQSRPYLVVEGSVHKAMLGHNLQGGPLDPVASCRWFVDHIGAGLRVDLPAADDWLARRLDWAEVFALDYACCEAFIRGLAVADFPRRSPRRYGDQSVMVPGRTTSVKVYHKGPEFAVHDRPRLGKVLSSEAVARLQWRANELLRVEVEIKARKLDTDMDPPAVGRLSEEHITGLYDREVAKLLRESQRMREIVRTAEDVRRRLNECYTPAQASALFGSWMSFATLGEDWTRDQLPRSTFYDHRKKLIDAGCSWHGADVALVESGPLPAGFSLLRSSPWRVTGEDPKVSELLAPYRVA